MIEYGGFPNRLVDKFIELESKTKPTSEQPVQNVQNAQDAPTPARDTPAIAPPTWNVALGVVSDIVKATGKLPGIDRGKAFSWTTYTACSELMLSASERKLVERMIPGWFWVDNRAEALAGGLVVFLAENQKAPDAFEPCGSLTKGEELREACLNDFHMSLLTLLLECRSPIPETMIRNQHWRWLPQPEEQKISIAIGIEKHMLAKARAADEDRQPNQQVDQQIATLAKEINKWIKRLRPDKKALINDTISMVRKKHMQDA